MGCSQDGKRENSTNLDKHLNQLLASRNFLRFAYLSLKYTEGERGGDKQGALGRRGHWEEGREGRGKGKDPSPSSIIFN